jgi:hypothetical protein
MSFQFLLVFFCLLASLSLLIAEEEDMTNLPEACLFLHKVSKHFELLPGFFSTKYPFYLL